MAFQWTLQWLFICATSFFDLFRQFLPINGTIRDETILKGNPHKREIEKQQKHPFARRIDEEKRKSRGKVCVSIKLLLFNCAVIVMQSTTMVTMTLHLAALEWAKLSVFFPVHTHTAKKVSACEPRETPHFLVSRTQVNRNRKRNTSRTSAIFAQSHYIIPNNLAVALFRPVSMLNWSARLEQTRGDPL